jgi:hypothetical protein
MNNSENKSCGKIFSLKNLLKCIGYFVLFVLVMNAISSASEAPLKVIIGLLGVIVYQLWIISEKLNK